MPIYQIIILALIQGAAELLPVSSSAHVIVAEKLMGLDPTAPALTFLLVMLHTGTMFAVLAYFWPKWAPLFSKRELENRGLPFLKYVMMATLVTGIVGFGLKNGIERIFLGGVRGPGEIEELFGNFPLMGSSLFVVGILIFWAGKSKASPKTNPLNPKKSALIGLVQGLCLPFRGFSRSGATISTGLLLKLDREASEIFSFALALVLTPPVLALEILRLLKVRSTLSIHELLVPGFLGMLFAAVAGFLALKLLSRWLEGGKWSYFGYYCMAASIGVFYLAYVGY